MKTVERSMNAERVSNVKESVKDNTRKALGYIKANKKSLLTGAIEVSFVGAAIYFLYKGKIVYAVGSICGALLTKHLVASGIVFYNGAKNAGSRIFRGNEQVEACNAEEC